MAPRPASALRRFLENEAASGLVLMGAAALALVIANTPLRAAYEAALHLPLGPLSLQHWINDGLMAAFFLVVGLEIKREMLEGHLATWPRRALPGIAAAGGMAVPALIYAAFNLGTPETLRGWAIPSATDIAFALGVLSLLGPRVPASLRVFLAALAIIDDLGAVLIIALFYNSGLSVPDLAGAGLVLALLVAANRAGVRRLLPYLLLGLVLWVLVLRSGIHATLAGVALALCVPLDPGRGRAEAESPLRRLQAALQVPVAFLIVPLFGLANAGVAFLGTGAGATPGHVAAGVAAGLLLGKVTGVLGASLLAIRLGLADRPAHASGAQLMGTSLLCGIGFTMSLFIALLAFPGSPALQDQAKIGILAGSLLSALAGSAVLLRARPEPVPTPSR